MDRSRFGVYTRLFDPGNPDDPGEPAWRVTQNWVIDVQALGVKYVRFLLSSFRNDNSIDFDSYRTIGQMYVDQDISLLAIVNGESFREGDEFPANGRSNGSDEEFDTYVAQFADCAETVAGELNGVIAAIEVWNEPNAAGTFVQPERFGRMLATCYPRMKAINPALEVVMAGLIYNDDAMPSGFDEQYLTAVYDSPAIVEYHDATGQYPWDHLGFHPYHNPVEGRVISSLQAVRDLQQARGDGTNIWVTEFGTRRPTAELDGTADPGDLTQAQALDTLYSQALDNDFVGVAFWNKHEQTRDFDGEEWFGLTPYSADVVPDTRIMELSIAADAHWPAWDKLSELIHRE